MAQPWQSPYIGNSGSNSGNIWIIGGPGSSGSSSNSYTPYVVSSNWSPPVSQPPNPNVINNAMNRANAGKVNEANAGIIPFSIAVGAALSELSEVALISITGVVGVLLPLLTISGDTRQIVNPSFPQPHTTSKEPAPDYGVRGFDNKGYPPPDVPKWFWPSVGAAASYQLYKLWPFPNIPKAKNDKQTIIPYKPKP